MIPITSVITTNASARDFAKPIEKSCDACANSSVLPEIVKSTGPDAAVSSGNSSRAISSMRAKAAS